jgi:short-subunit dehydrogenase
MLPGPKMAARERGGIGIVSSLAATSGSINYSAYNAGKAFQWIFGETLWSEMKEVGVNDTTLLAGSMPSPGYDRYVVRFDPTYAEGMDSEDLFVLARAPDVPPLCDRRSRESALRRTCRRSYLLFAFN